MKTITELLEAVNKSGGSVCFSSKNEIVEISIKYAVQNTRSLSVVADRAIFPITHSDEGYPEINELFERFSKKMEVSG